MRSAGSKESKEGALLLGKMWSGTARALLELLVVGRELQGLGWSSPGLGRELPALGRELLGMYSSAETSPQVLDRLRTSLIHMRPRGYQTRDFSSSLT